MLHAPSQLKKIKLEGYKEFHSSKEAKRKTMWTTSRGTVGTARGKFL